MPSIEVLCALYLFAGLIAVIGVLWADKGGLIDTAIAVVAFLVLVLFWPVVLYMEIRWRLTGEPVAHQRLGNPK